ncbi:hypothetical protein L6452_21251 [Arctium lappa]|uniref:Uncharacterized protein n=1 Tax=Arctium lappa TaxID=4217 RepID=A0ACB9BDQ4_ARCLA|nr:hypothetical protein L6452_21251 [Arctium lappa]
MGRLKLAPTHRPLTAQRLTELRRRHHHHHHQLDLLFETTERSIPYRSYRRRILQVDFWEILFCFCELE